MMQQMFLGLGGVSEKYWIVTLGGSGNDYGNGIAHDASGNVYATGYGNSDGPGGNDLIVSKYDKDGNKTSEQNYKNGSPDGLSIRWHDNGKKREEFFIRDGYKDKVVRWNDKGEILMEMSWSDINKKGNHKEYHENGAIKWEITFNEEKIISAQFSNLDGEIKILKNSDLNRALSYLGKKWTADDTIDQDCWRAAKSYKRGRFANGISDVFDESYW